MDDWKIIKLGDLFEIKAGGDLQEDFYSNYYQEITPYPIFSNSLINKGLYGYTSKARYPKNCITITGRGSLGHAEYRDEPFDAIVRLLVLIPKKDVDCIYITNYINSRMNFAIESTGVPQLTAPKVINTKILVPSNKTEQTAIANLLSKVDEAIKATENSIKAAERLKKSLMQNLLTGKLKPDGSWRTKEELMSTKYGYAFKNWKYCKINDLIKEGFITKVQDGNHGESHPVSAEFVDEGIPFVMASDISNGFVDIINCKKITKKRADQLRIGFAFKGDVLLSHKASIGYTCIVDESDPYIMLTPQVTLYRVDQQKLIPEYLLYFFQLYTFQMILEGNAKQSTRNYEAV